ncbi:type II toxin-antitoxin system HipA family toxin [Sulfurimonas sp.]|uniref:type II toxin-antitoxin system HipA family toxin n=1 Tax=Sulfurimonas sp. TaxID=2022749 RepID=UPI003D138BF4
MNSTNTTVFVNKTDTGTLSFEDERYVFNYHTNADDIVSLTMPIRSASWDSKNLHPIFQMNMPEGALKETIKKHFAKIYSMNDLNFLKLIGPYMLGRVKFEKIIDQSDTLELDDILHTTKEDLFHELMEKFAIRSGVSGVQPKLLLKAHNKTTMKFEHYIVKSWENDYPHLALNEYFCMRACRLAGLDVAEFYMSEDHKMFVMKRFDIDNDGTYLGFEDMCVLTAKGTDQKYDGSYEECVRVIKDVISPQKRKEALKTFFKALVMNHLLKNGDGHLKNYGVLYKNDFRDSYLAPIYDVITTTVYLKHDIPALRLSDAKLWWREKTYKTFALQSCGLTNKEYQSILQDCTKAIIATKNEIKNYSCDETTKEFLDHLTSQWSEEITSP